MIQTSEYCALGHPDRTCDYIACYILDRYLERDPNARVALEVQLKDVFCTVSGEVTSTVEFTDSDIARFCREAVCAVGYTREYRDFWGVGNCICGDDLDVVCHISRQSPDIARGVNGGGWGDQGIFWGLAVNRGCSGDLPRDYFIARALAKRLYLDSFELELPIGLDIKTQITIEEDKLTNCVVAAPVKPGADSAALREAVHKWLAAWRPHSLYLDDDSLIINGTGEYVRHGSIADCGTTGRKLVADFYGGNSRIGGGSPWGKDPTKADVALNILARRKALKYMHEKNLPEVRCAISCCIGRPEVRVAYFDNADNLLQSQTETVLPSTVLDDLDLRKPRYADMCRDGLFGHEWRTA